MLRVRSCGAVAVGLTVLLSRTAAAQGGGGGGDGVQCGDTITTNTRLTHDLECSGIETPALRVMGPGVVLDLGGHTVRRTGSETGWSEGIVVMANSTVRNGTIRGFDLGYVLDSNAEHFPEHVRLSRLRFIGNRVAVYNRSGSATFTITDSLLLGNELGLSSEQDASSGTFEVRATLFMGNRLALTANSHSVNVVRSTFSFNELVVWCPYGSISFRSSSIVQNEVVGRLPIGEFGYGLCSEVSVVDTVIARNGALAPSSHPAWEPFDLELRGSRIVDNDSGLDVRALAVEVQGNTWRGNGGGLTLADLPDYVPPPLSGTVSGNRFLYNQGDGLRVTVPSTLTVSRNVAIGNMGWGIYVEEAVDGGGNVARGNAEGDCTGVACSSR